MLWQCIWWVTNCKTCGEKKKEWDFCLVLVFNVAVYTCFEIMGNVCAVGWCVHWTRVKGQGLESGFRVFLPLQPCQSSGRTPRFRNTVSLIGRLFGHQTRAAVPLWEASCRNPSSWHWAGVARGNFLACFSWGQGGGFQLWLPDRFQELGMNLLLSSCGVLWAEEKSKQNWWEGFESAWYVPPGNACLQCNDKCTHSPFPEHRLTCTTWECQVGEGPSILACASIKSLYSVIRKSGIFFFQNMNSGS